MQLQLKEKSFQKSSPDVCVCACVCVRARVARDGQLKRQNPKPSFLEAQQAKYSQRIRANNQRDLHSAT